MQGFGQSFGDALDALIAIGFMIGGALICALVMMLIAIWVPVSWWMFGAILAGASVGYLAKKRLFRD